MGVTERGWVKHHLFENKAKAKVMKTISIKQPYASLIANGIKDIENRTWKCPKKYIGQRGLIHASMGWYRDLAEICLGDLVKPHLEDLRLIHRYDDEETGYKGYSFSFPHGAIIGSVEIVDCVINHPSIWAEKTIIECAYGSCKYPDKDEKPYCIDCSHLKNPIYNWVLAHPRLFPEPITVNGKLGFWDFPNILAEPEETDGELFCHCQLPVKERNQVYSMIDHFRCRYCGGRWYK